ncbi:MAG: hypothetical protein DKM22_06705 [Candidatus Melainabacteria bacterium]|nr:MAG: hypothetical protein DKM22_06705 [Candidatus Melainabacteria bacterium]
MITKEVNDFLKKIECGTYNSEDAVYEFSRIAKYLTKEELVMIKEKLSNLLKERVSEENYE